MKRSHRKFMARGRLLRDDLSLEMRLGLEQGAPVRRSIPAGNRSLR